MQAAAGPASGVGDVERRHNQSLTNRGTISGGNGGTASRHPRAPGRRGLSNAETITSSDQQRRDRRRERRDRRLWRRGLRRRRSLNEQGARSDRSNLATGGSAAKTRRPAPSSARRGGADVWNAAGATIATLTNSGAISGGNGGGDGTLTAGGRRGVSNAGTIDCSPTAARSPAETAAATCTAALALRAMRSPRAPARSGRCQRHRQAGTCCGGLPLQVVRGPFPSRPGGAPGHGAQRRGWEATRSHAQRTLSAFGLRSAG